MAPFVEVSCMSPASKTYPLSRSTSCSVPPLESQRMRNETPFICRFDDPNCREGMSINGTTPKVVMKRFSPLLGTFASTVATLGVHADQEGVWVISFDVLKRGSVLEGMEWDNTIIVYMKHR